MEGVNSNEMIDRKQLNLDLYRKLYLIRAAEEKICEHYPEDDMKTPVHLSIGEEAIAVGVIHALGHKDQFFGTYRSHGIYLARTLDTDGFFSELYGKASGVGKGKVGSMHLSAPEFGFMGTSAIVGSIIPVAVGAAFANKMNQNGRVVAVFFGDGATDEGVFWESLNLACLMNLPILFVCEDNELAVHTHKKFRHGYGSITDIVSSFDCDLLKSKSTDVEVVYNVASKAVNTVRAKRRPCFLYLRYYRYKEHVGIFEDFDCGYRSKKEFDEWYKIDPVNLQREKLTNLFASEEEIKKIEKQIDEKIEKSLLLAKKADFPSENEIYRDVIL